MNWSGGKDSAFALYQLKRSNTLDILCLLTSLSQPYNRITMHGVRAELLEQQAAAIGIPLVKMMLPEQADMVLYEQTMRNTLVPLIEKGATASVFGDIFLEDLRKYREDKLAELGLKGIFPLWGKSTKHLMSEFIDAGFKTIVTCVNEQYLDKSFAGRIIDHNFIKDLPKEVDPCGENGEFHTFTFDGPLFAQPILFKTGELVYKTYDAPKKDSAENSSPTYGFWFCDLLAID